MKIIDQLKNRSSLIYLGVLVIGIFLGWAIFGNSGSSVSSDRLHEDHVAEDHQTGTVYTCAMHPQIRSDKPGNCPLCGMELIPLLEEEDDGAEGDYTIKLTNAAMKIAEVSTSVIQKKAPYKEVYLPGKVMPDERRISQLTARFPGRIEKLHVNFTGQKVKKGQILAQIYSPELVTTQKELFEAMKLKDTNPNYYRAVRNKLKLWDLTESQIDEITNSGEVKFYFDILSPLSGTVTMRHIALGDYIKEGDALFEIIDLSHVWVMFDAYESDIPWVKLRDKIKFTIRSIPDKVFESTVTFIDPVLNPNTRVVGVRTELNNPKDLLKPNMLASGILNAMLAGNKDQLLVPKSAVLWTGKKSVVYVRTNNHDNMFLYTEVTLGADAGDYYVVGGGLNEGDLVASNGVFKIDAAAQLHGKQSMMNPEGGKQSLGGHAGMDMGGDSKDMKPESDLSAKKKIDVENINPKFKSQLGDVVINYLEMKDALVNDNGEKSIIAAKQMKAAIGHVNMKLLIDNDTHMMWMKAARLLKEQIDLLNRENDIEKQRAVFSKISDNLTNVIQVLGVDLGRKALYLQFCPMANDNGGAFWLSMDKDIENPYFGASMLKCGEVRETLTK